VRRPGSVWALRAFIACATAFAPLMVSASPASAACAGDPNALPIRQMITMGTTGSDRFEMLFLGRVVRLHDLGGDAGGPTLARFLVKEHPVGFAPRGARVRFWKPPPNVSASENLEFKLGHRYAVVAHRRSNGVFGSDGACGQTTQLSQDRMRRLIRLSRHS
jgi:hypothetical protein